MTRRYFATRGPATLQDFAWWSGLTVALAQRGVEAAGRWLVRETHHGAHYWSAPSTRSSRPWSRVAHLLANYDEHFIGFKDRSAFEERLRGPGAKRRMNALRGHMVFVDGQMVGGWARTLGKTVDVVLHLAVPLTALERSLVRRAADRFGQFLGRPVRLRSGMDAARRR